MGHSHLVGVLLLTSDTCHHVLMNCLLFLTEKPGKIFI